MSNAHWLRDTSFVVLCAQAIMVLSLILKGTIKVLLEKAGLGCIPSKNLLRSKDGNKGAANIYIIATEC